VNDLEPLGVRERLQDVSLESVDLIHAFDDWSHAKVRIDLPGPIMRVEWHKWARAWQGALLARSWTLYSASHATMSSADGTRP
jgi:hypothetical protein